VPSPAPTHSIERVAFHFHRMLPEFVWDASALEGNPLTFIEVKTLVDGVTVGGHKISDQAQVLNLIDGVKRLLALVKTGKFSLDKTTFTELHGLVANNKAVAWDSLRGDGKEPSQDLQLGLGGRGQHTPLATEGDALELNRTFDNGLLALQSEVPQPFEKAAAFLMFGALQKFFVNGNTRASALMMNGILMSAGMDAISVPASKAQLFRESMVRFYAEKDATEVL
jgi:hypothetical protein